MHEEILYSKQRDLLPFIASFSDNFGLIGGTTIALQVGHRRSNDFDNEFNEILFREQPAYFEDIDYSEEVDYVAGFSVTDEVVKKKLTELSLEIERGY